MKKTNLLIAALLLWAIPAFTQKNTNPKSAPAPARPVQNTANFLFISDIHLESALASNPGYGQPYDTGMELWQSFLNTISAVMKGGNSPRFVIYTGDLPAHAPSSGTDHSNNIALVLQALRNTFAIYKTPFLYLPGNNDGIAGDYTSFTNQQNQTPLSLVPETVNPYPALNCDTSGTTAPCLLSKTNIPMGYYSAKPIAGLRVIALNTVIFHKGFIQANGTVDTAMQRTQGDAQIAWLAAQLSEAAAAGDKVYLAMHIPPGMDAYQYKYTSTPYNPYMWDPAFTWQNSLLGLLAQHQQTIAGILYGHTHMDELRRLYDPSGNTITEVAISCPGITPNHNNNPGFKLVQYDSKSMELLDFTTYYTTPAATPWKTYSFNKTFGYKRPGNTLYQNLSADDSLNITNKMQKIYMVMNGRGKTYIGNALEVKPVQ